MVKRTFDLLFSLIGLFLLGPFLLFFAFLVWLQDFRSPFYISKRVGIKGKEFNLIKLRSMIVDADTSGVNSTSSNDSRITPIGNTIRRYKIDEIPQLLNVFLGQMSLVGPRPQVLSDVKLYTSEENSLLEIKPGITDFSSIIFADEGDILESSSDPDLKYNQIIRPWKSRLGLLYIKKRNFFLDIKIIIITVYSIIQRKKALLIISRLLLNIGAETKLVSISRRDNELLPYPPPGSDQVISERS